jgi:hypothetical protein
MTRGSRPTIASAVESLTKPRSMTASGPAAPPGRSVKDVRACLGELVSDEEAEAIWTHALSAFRPGSSWESVAAHAMSELIELGEAREREAFEL